MKSPHLAAAPLLVGVGLLLATAPAQAQLSMPGPAAEQQLDVIRVSAARPAFDPNLPATLAGKGADELAGQNLVNVEDALKYLPSTTLRKRYIGDRNGLIGGRSYSTLQAPRGLAYVDGYLISNFLGRFDAPRWSTVAPEEIARVDQFQGPFSALYPGNSIGSTTVITTRRPQRREADVRFTAFTERFDLYGLDERYPGAQLSARLADRLGDLSWTLSGNALDVYSHPMQYYTVQADASGRFPTPAAGRPVAVSGIQYDTDPQGRRRAVFGANGGAIDHTQQQQAKLRLAYAPATHLSADGFVMLWQNRSAARNRSFLRDAEGRTVWSGLVSDRHDPTRVFSLPASAWAPSDRRETHWHTGASLKTRNARDWNGRLTASWYRVHEDWQRTADHPDPIAFSERPGSGSVTRRDGTGWRTFEAQASHSPLGSDGTGGSHQPTLGVYQNDYTLRNIVRSASDWRSGDQALSQHFGGRTRVRAAYVQDAWSLHEQWQAVLGVRREWWDAWAGSQFIAGTAALEYPNRRIAATSPKLALNWFSADQASVLRLSAGRGYRFPTVAELFQGTRSGTSIQINDPNLQPERADALEFAAEHQFRRQTLRVALFRDDVRNTIFAQTQLGTTNVTTVQNVGRVTTRGVELVWKATGLFGAGVDTEVTATYADAVIRENSLPATIGKHWPRVPRLRSTATFSWQLNERWTWSAAGRYAGRQWNQLDNSDVNPDVYGGASRLKSLDTRLVYRPQAGMQLALGIDNLTDSRAYQSHPYPARSFFGEVKYAF